MPNTTVYELSHARTINGKEYAEGTPIAAIVAPDGVDPARIVSGILRGLIVPVTPPPAPAPAAAPELPGDESPAEPAPPLAHDAPAVVAAAEAIEPPASQEKGKE